MIQTSEILEAAKSGQRLSEADALYLYEYADLLELGAAADEVNRAKNKNDVYYNVNRHINPTNVCAMSCKFCAFSRKPGQAGAYEYSIDEMVEKAHDAVKAGATEVHMVGGLHPRWRFGHYLEIISAIKQAHPTLHVKAFTAVEIDWLAAKARLTIEQTLMKLKEAGLDSMPGGGAEIFHPEVRNRICDTKTDAERWLMIHRTAHSVGLRSNCTMLYGHIERLDHRIDHMRRLRELQDETEGFNVFIPLAFQPFDNSMGINRYTIGTDDLRTIAVARLFLDNFQHIKAYWIMLGQDVAQLALNFGANDLDGTVTEEKISRMAGGRAGMAMGKKEIQSLIRKANKTPVERDTLYRAVWRDSEENQLFADKSKESAAAMILYRIEQGEPVDAEKAQLLADYASLFQLGHCSNLVRDRIGLGREARVTESLTPPSPEDFIQPEIYLAHLGALPQEQGPAILEIDLGDAKYQDGEFSLEHFDRFITCVGQKYPQIEVHIRGVKGLWSLARTTKINIEDCIRSLSTLGVRTISSSEYESETDLTTDELLDFHKICHLCDIGTSAKVELSADYSGVKHPFWRPFIKRVEALVNLQKETGGLQALSIEVSKDSRVTPTEYFRALALTRIIAFNIPRVLAPVHKIPTIRPRADVYENSALNPVLKIAPLAVYFGASDLGSIKMSEGFAKTLANEVTISGIRTDLFGHLPVDAGT